MGPSGLKGMCWEWEYTRPSPANGVGGATDAFGRLVRVRDVNFPGFRGLLDGTVPAVEEAADVFNEVAAAVSSAAPRTARPRVT